LWQALAEIPEHFVHFVRLVEQLRPDVVQVEETYMWPVVRKLLGEGRIDGARVVHSSYNFETDHQRDLATIKGPVHEYSLKQVAATEREIAAASDLVVTVSDADAASFRAIGAMKVVVARNGCRQVAPHPDALRAVDAYFGEQRFALFVSSAHLPNMQGLLDLTRVPVETLPGRLVIGGTVCDLLTEHRSASSLIRHATFMGMVDVALLDALLTRAAVVLLPKTRGGGSNLKTSEALHSYRPVVATTQAFVGFEPWRDAPGVTVVDDPLAFWRQVRWHLENPLIDNTATWCAQREGLLWENCLQPMVVEVEKLASTRLQELHR
jgi:glycosyltransferase involved in cell wall biosynthesis